MCFIRNMTVVAALIVATSGLALAQNDEVEVPYARGGPIGIPNYYVVQHGDTLERICEAFYGTTFAWPQVWSYNPHITNPHWIYPGDVIFLRPPAAPGEGADMRPPGRPGTHFPLGGFYTGTELEEVGFIRFSPVPNMTLSIFDDVYIEFYDPSSVRVGERFALNRVIDRVYEEGELAAVKYTVTGVVEVISKPADSPLVQGRIIQAWDMIERGDVLFLNQRQVRVVERVPATVNASGQIIDFLEPTLIAAESFYTFIDIGYNDGVREGNELVIWDRYDEYAELIDGRPGFEEDEHIEDMPWIPMGTAMVVFTTDEFCTAVITTSRIELFKGMRVTVSPEE